MSELLLDSHWAALKYSSIISMAQGFLFPHPHATHTESSWIDDGNLLFTRISHTFVVMRAASCQVWHRASNERMTYLLRI